MLVPFPFTFRFSVPGLVNPFSPNHNINDFCSHAPPQVNTLSNSGRAPQSPVLDQNQNQYYSKNIEFLATVPVPMTATTSYSQSPSQNLVQTCHISPSPSLVSLSHPQSTTHQSTRGVKRGWEPAFAEPSQSATLTSTSGYLDTPSKYREMTQHSSEELPPPPKRRRGLAGSIVSTAVNAALIGTAVGLTVYRLWRDRGKDQSKTISASVSASLSSPRRTTITTNHQQLPPPPPYEERDWIPVSHPTSPMLPSAPAPTSHALLPPAPTPRRKVLRQSVKRPRRTRIHHRGHSQVIASPGRTTGAPQPEFDFGTEADVVEDQINWIGDKLAQLIEEGKRALNKEVVVMSDAKEDEEDDGDGVWEEEEEEDGRLTRTGSIKRRQNIYGSSKHNASTSSHYLPTTPKKSCAGHARGLSTESVLREDENAWESPELRESMRKARERVLAARGIAVPGGCS